MDSPCAVGIPKVCCPLWRLAILAAVALVWSSYSPSAAESYEFGPTVQATGPEETVFDWSTDRCTDEDSPDSPARALRYKEGTTELVQVTRGQGPPPFVNLDGTVRWEGNRRLIGRTLNLQDLSPEHQLPSLWAPGANRSCPNSVTHTNPFYPHPDQPDTPRRAALPPPNSSYDPSNPANFHDVEWVIAPWVAQDGRTVHSLAHNNYRGWRDFNHDGLYDDCPSTDPDLVVAECWYASATVLKSTDGGATFGEAGTWTHLPTGLAPPNHLAFSIPYPYVGGQGRQGIPGPTNIVKRRVQGIDYYYTMFQQQLGNNDPDRPRPFARTCLARTRNLDTPSSWVAWGDGPDSDTVDSFEVQFVNPYTYAFTSSDGPEKHLCKEIRFGGLTLFPRSLTYNTYLKRYMVLGSAGSVGSGFAYALSADLLNWEAPQLLMRTQPPTTCSDPNSVGYPSIIDNNDPAASRSSQERNFYQPDKSAYLYYTSGNRRDFPCPGGNAHFYDTDLRRVPITFLLNPPK